jgi:hypothetical protein
MKHANIMQMQKKRIQQKRKSQVAYLDKPKPIRMKCASDIRQIPTVPRKKHHKYETHVNHVYLL